MLSFISEIATEFKTEQGKEKYHKAQILRMIRIPCCCIFGNTFAYFQKEEGGIISAVGAYLAIILWGHLRVTSRSCGRVFLYFRMKQNRINHHVTHFITIKI